jgi:hypothetical protein
MLGITQESMWIVIVVLMGAVIAAIMIAFFTSQGQGGYGYELFRRMWYDLMYFFFGPRIVEV